jgi:hypothetical protein
MVRPLIALFTVINGIPDHFEKAKTILHGPGRDAGNSFCYEGMAGRE